MADEPTGLVEKARSLPAEGTYTLPDASLAFLRGGGWKPIQTIGTFAQTAYGGWLTSRERNPALAGLRKYETYADLLANVSIISAGVRLFMNLLAGVDWKVQAPEGKQAKASKLADLTEDMLDSMTIPWSLVVQRASLYRFYGFSLQEWTAIKRDDGAIGLKDIESRAQFTIERWDLDLSGTVLGVIQRSPEDLRAIYLPRGKLVYIADLGLTDSPDGIGILRHVARNASQLERYEQLEGFGYETDLRGIPKARAPISQLQQAIGKVVGGRTITQADVNNAITGLNDFLANHIVSPQQGILLDSEPHRDLGPNATPSATAMFDLELMAGPTKSHADIAKAIERLNRQMARVLGVEHLMLGGDGKGSMALSESKMRGFSDLLNATLREMAKTFDKDVIGAIWTLNGWDPALKPTLKPDPVSLRAVEEATKALLDLAQSGATILPGDPVVNQVRGMLGLEAMPDELIDSAAADAMLPQAVPTGAANQNAPTPANGNKHAEEPGAQAEEAGARDAADTAKPKAAVKSRGAK